MATCQYLLVLKSKALTVCRGMSDTHIELLVCLATSISCAVECHVIKCAPLLKSESWA